MPLGKIISGRVLHSGGNWLSWVIGSPKRSPVAGMPRASGLIHWDNGFRFRSHDGLNRREGAGGVVGSHMFQHVGCRLNWTLTNLVYADRVPAIFACHKRAACDVSSPDVHASSLRSIVGRCRGHWDSDHRLGCCQMSVSRFLQGECQSVWDQRVHERRGLKPVAEGGREQGYCSAGSDSETRKAKLDAEFHTGDYSKKCLSYLSYRRPHGDGFLCG